MTENSKEGGRKRMKLGEILVEAGLVDVKTLEKALDLQKMEKKRIGKILIDMGVADDQEIAKALSRQLGIPLVRLQGMEIPESIISLVPPGLAESYLLVPVKREDKGLVVAMANPLEFYALDDLRFVTRMPISIAVAPEGEIIDALGKYYSSKGLERDLGSGPEMEQGIEIIRQETREEKDDEDLMSLTELPPVVRFTNSLIADAIIAKASDIHIEPQKTAVMVRYRIDGIMREIMKTDRHVHSSLVSRIKVTSGMDISIRRRPQDGRVQVRYGAKTYDLRVSTIPTSYGEKVVMRILDPDKAKIDIRTLGLSDHAFEAFSGAIGRPQGLILVTGPTGSGKTTTLYACLNRLNLPEVNIITVEDPVEYDLKGVNQVQINPKAGITFAEGLRSILRQDPDIVMVGEIRDAETASIAIQAANTGHLVLSTLHTNDAASAVTRLLDLGADAFLISSSLTSVMAQRLVRGVCQECKIPEPLSPEILKRLPPGIDGGQEMPFQKGAGCEACQYTGYAGRLGLFEVLTITPSIREMIVPGVPAEQIKRQAGTEGFRNMSMDGIKKALKGLTTIEEVLRVAPPEVGEGLQEPIVEASTADETEPDETRPDELFSTLSPARPRKILVADDSEIVIKIIRNLLESEGYFVLAAEDGVEALRLALSERPDLLITDYLMPRMDGLTLIKKLKAQLATRYIPIIMLTAKDEMESEVKGIEAGADDYLTKPVNPKRLLARIHRLMKKN